MNWISDLHRDFHEQGPREAPSRLIVWGQSIGAGVATNLAARLTTTDHTVPIDALILETPFLSIRAMLETLYPQRWVPYKHLWPFLRNHLDSWRNMVL